ncbi:MAG TPA: hypothetical protein PKA95_18455 [Thermomicrobiales bacterium]|nr:hypothetical protein [Thermomicrobiales bacterium]
MDDELRSEQQDAGEPSTDDIRDDLVREGRRRAAIWGVLTGLVMTVVALGCILLLYLAVGR